MAKLVYCVDKEGIVNIILNQKQATKKQKNE